MARVLDTVGLFQDRRSSLRCAAAAGCRVMRCGKGCPAGLGGEWAPRGWCVALFVPAATTPAAVAGGQRAPPGLARGGGGSAPRSAHRAATHSPSVTAGAGQSASGKPVGGRRRCTQRGNVSARRCVRRLPPYQSQPPACGRLAGERASRPRSPSLAFSDPPTFPNTDRVRVPTLGGYARSTIQRANVRLVGWQSGGPTTPFASNRRPHAGTVSCNGAIQANS